MQSRRFGLTAPGLVKLRDLAIELLEVVKTNMPMKSGKKNAWKFEKAHSLRLSTEVNRIGHKFQPSFGGANWREPEGWSCIPL